MWEGLMNFLSGNGGETMVGGQQATSPGHEQYLQQQQVQDNWMNYGKDNQGGPPPVTNTGGTSNGQGYPGSEYGPDALGAFEKAPHMSQYANMGGLMSPIHQQQQRQQRTPKVDAYLASLMG